MYNVEILADSVNETGNRLTTFELTYPRFVHAELMTHRLFSRNAASSRAIPTKKLMQRIREQPVMPKWWGKNQSGMQAKIELEGEELEAVKEGWLQARNLMLGFAAELRELGLHKQIANRILEPWMFITVIVSATEYDNWFYLRDSEFAQPEIAWVAREMRKQYDENEPEELLAGQWHTPLIKTRREEWKHPLFVSCRELPDDEAEWGLIKISTARCARVSYLTHQGKRDIEADIELCNRLSKSGHWSPFEHVAMACPSDTRYGNFFGFKQYRKFFATEHFGKEME